MDTMIEIEKHGKLFVHRSAWNGRYSFLLDGKCSVEVGKKEYEITLKSGEVVHITTGGNIFTGLYIEVDGIKYPINQKIEIYFFIITIAIATASMAIGNIPSFAEMGFYYVGGAIGGGISGCLCALAIGLCIAVKKKWLKWIVCLADLLLTFFICFGLGNLIVSLLTK